MAQAPQVEYLRELKGYVQGRFGAQKRMIEATRELRSLLHTIEIPPQYKKTAQVVKTPILADAVQRTTATLTVNERTWRATPLNNTERAQEDATLREQWMTALQRRMEREAN